MAWTSASHLLEVASAKPPGCGTRQMLLSRVCLVNWKLAKELLGVSWEAHTIDSMLLILASGLLVIEGGTSTLARMGNLAPSGLEERLWVVSRWPWKLI